MKSIDTSVELLGAQIMVNYIHGHIIQATTDVGLVNVVQVTIDNASNCKLIGSMITKEFPHILWTLCATHYVDLMVEGIGKLNSVKEVLGVARRLVKFVTKKIEGFGIV